MNRQCCDHCNLLHKKIQLYEEFFKRMKDIDDQDIKLHQDLEESFMVIDKGKDLNELTMREYKSIKEQDNLHNYDKMINYTEQAQGVYKIFGYIVKIGKFFF